jgi:hypothetical protein
MTKAPVLTNVTQLNNNSLLTAINSNNDAIKTAFENTLSLDGSTPNAMNADIDLNGNDLLNVNIIDADNLIVAGTNLNDQVSAAANSAQAAAYSEVAAALSAAQALEFGETYADISGDGVTDVTSALKNVIEAGGVVRIRAGNYLIAGAGPDTGGVNAVITKNLMVICEPGVRFFTDNLDNDLIRISVPSNGSGLPADGVDVFWFGGFFDQRLQKQSTSVPFRSEYPAPTGFDGASATCDALSIRGDYTISGTDYHGISNCVVEGITCIAGTHWETAGGDSGLFLSGCRSQTVRESVFVANRDLGVYASGSNNSQLRCRTTIENCIFRNCMFAASAKRSCDSVKITGNDAINCVRGFSIDSVGGEICEGVTISGNTGSSLNQGVRVVRTRGYAVENNHFTQMGAYRADGTTVFPNVVTYGVYIEGSSGGFIAHNSCRGVGAGVAEAFPSDYSLVRLVAHTSGDTLNSDNNIILQNFGDGLRTAGQIAGTNNAAIQNVVANAVTGGNFTTLGTQGHEFQVNTSNGLHSFSTNVGFADGTVGNPGIFRRSGTNNGIRFGANLVGIVANGTDRIVADGTGVGFLGATPVARPTVSGSRGANAALASLLTALSNLGLITNSTSA